MLKTFFLLLVLASVVAGCKSASGRKLERDTPGLDQNKDSIDRFWDWFAANEKSFRGFQTDPDGIIHQVGDSARKIERGLAIEFEPPKNNVINMTVSADGNRDLFPLVEKMVEKAPKLEGWHFFAFRQRIPKDQVRGMVMKMQGVELNPDQMKFFPMPVGDSLDLIIYSKGVTEGNFNQVAYGGLVLVDNILGEYDCVKKVRKYDFQNMPTGGEELKGLMPLVDLPEYVDSFYKSKGN